MRDVYVAGVGMTRFGKFPDASVGSLAEEATAGALADAGLSPSQVEMTFFANVENACASASSAFYFAWMAVASGGADVALAVGSEKLTRPDKQKSFDAIGTAVDVAERAEIEARLGTSGGHRSSFMDIYAGMAREYMAASGATVADFARVVVKNQRHGALNPKAQYGGEFSVEEVLASREVASPLTLLMCSPLCDGAAAVVLCSAERARRIGAEVKVASTVLLSGRDLKGTGPKATERAARLAYEEAGIGPEDVDVVEVHDAAAPAELVVYEEIGLCGPGEGPKLLASGETTLGGRVPVNPSGGLLAKGHPISATGCAQIVELVDQLRGRGGARQVEGARAALAENGGGSLGDDLAAVVVAILTR